jgi:hypothetical protein
MHGEVYVMLDYAAMDMQHSIKSQYEVTKALCDWLGMPDNYKEYYLSMESNQFVKAPDGTIKKLAYSLLTGRRTTTFKNSVLNYVYLKLATQESWSAIESMYNTGDDVVLKTKDTDSAYKLIKKCTQSKSIFNERKQSWGRGAEFLRHAVYKDFSIGYVNRSIASFICGSWVNDLKLTGGSMLQVMARYAWTINLRARLFGLTHNLYHHAVHKRCKVSKAEAKRICLHKISIDGSPVCTNSDVATVMEPRVQNIVEEATVKNSYATKDYLRTLYEPFPPLRDKVLQNTLQKRFCEASHMKGLTIGYEEVSRSSHLRVVQHKEFYVSNQLIRQRHKGIMSEHPTLPSVQKRMSFKELDFLTFLITSERYKGEIPLDQFFWGRKSSGVNSMVCYSFDDLVQTGKIELVHKSSVFQSVRLSRRCYY